MCFLLLLFFNFLVKMDMFCIYLFYRCMRFWEVLIYKRVGWKLFSGCDFIIFFFLMLFKLLKGFFNYMVFVFVNYILYCNLSVVYIVCMVIMFFLNGVIMVFVLENIWVEMVVYFCCVRFLLNLLLFFRMMNFCKFNFFMWYS